MLENSVVYTVQFFICSEPQVRVTKRWAADERASIASERELYLSFLCIYFYITFPGQTFKLNFDGLEKLSGLRISKSIREYSNILH